MSSYPILIGGVGLTKGRIKNIGLAMAAVCEEIKPIVEKARAFDGLPFNEINMIIRWAEKGVVQAEIGPLRKSKQVLEAATTIGLRDGKAIEDDHIKLEALVKKELKKVLTAVEVKYGMCQIDI